MVRSRCGARLDEARAIVASLLVLAVFEQSVGAQECLLCASTSLEVDFSSPPPWTPNGHEPPSPYPALDLDAPSIFDHDLSLCSPAHAASQIPNQSVAIQTPIDLASYPERADADDSQTIGDALAQEDARSRTAGDLARISTEATNVGRTQGVQSSVGQTPSARTWATEQAPRANSTATGQPNVNSGDSKLAGDDPVLEGSGEFAESAIDLELSGIGLPFKLVRQYRSQWSYEGLIGQSWILSVEEKLRVEPSCSGRRVEWLTGEGAIVRFREGSDRFHSEPPTPFKLAEESGQYVITHPDGVRSVFSAFPRIPGQYGLSKRIDLLGNTIESFWRNAFDHRTGEWVAVLDRIVDTLDREIDFIYGDDGFLDFVRVPALDLEVAYTIDELGDLRGVTNAGGVPVSYEYDHGFDPDETYIPNERLEPACEASCGHDPLCPEESACGRAESDAYDACMSTCTDPPSCTAACVGQCPTRCVEALANDPCESRCLDDCPEDCEARGRTMCEAYAEGREFEGEVLGNVRQLCTEQCEDFCVGKCNSEVICWGERCGFFPFPFWSCEPDGAVCRGERDCRSRDISRYTWTQDQPRVPALVVLEDGRLVPQTGWECSGERCYDCCLEGEDCPDRSCQAGRNCVDTCVNIFKYGTDRLPQACRVPDQPEEGCLDQLAPGCASSCARDCPVKCANDCTENCNTSCTESCADPSWCVSACLAVSSFQVTCEASCTDTCKTEHAHPSGGMTFGRPQELNHNLVRIEDGEGRVVLENIYGQDIFSPDFDRVTTQRLGTDETTYRHYKLNTPGGPAIAEAHRGIVDPAPESLDLCPSMCLTPSGRPPERWVHMVGDEFLVLAERSATETPLEAWAVTDTDWLDGYRWYELTRTGGNRARLEPPLHLAPAGFSIATSKGLVRVREREGVAGEVELVGLPVETLDAVLGAPRAGRLTLLRGATGWRAYASRVIGGATLSPASACADEFSVFSGGDTGLDGLGLMLEPKGACTGAAEIRELGRRDGRARMETWNSLLTDPSGTMSWDFAEGHPRRQGFTPAHESWTTPRDPWTDLCRPPLPREPEIQCLRAGDFGGFDDPGLKPPPCEVHYSRRDAVAAAGIGNDRRVPIALGCGPELFDELDDLPPEACPIAELGAPRSGPSGGGRQPITNARVVTDGKGIVRVFYADDQYRVLRVVNHDSGARIDRTYDTAGRFDAMRMPFGDRTCLEYNEAWDMTKRTRLPAEGHYAPVEAIEERFGYASHGRLADIYDPDDLSKKIVHHEWDWTTGLLESTTYPRLSLTRSFEHDDRGRPIRVTEPRGKTRLHYDDPRHGQVTSIDLDEGGANARTRTLGRNALGQVEHIEEPGKPTIDLVWMPDGRLSSKQTILRPSRASPALVTTYDFDAAGELVSITEPEKITHFTPNARGEIETVREEPRREGFETRVSCLGYDGRGDLTATIDPEGRKVVLTRDANGDVTQVERGIWRPVGEAWDDACESNVTDRAARASEIFETLTRSAAGFVDLHELGAPGAAVPWRTGYTYDGFGRAIEIRVGDAAIHRMGFDRRARIRWQAVLQPNAPALPAGLVDGVPDENDTNLVSLSVPSSDDLGRSTGGDVAWFVDEASGRRFLSTDGWIKTRIRYLDSTNVIEATDPDGHITRTTFDFYGRPTSTELPSAPRSTVTQSYADDGLQVTRTIAPANGTFSEVLTYTEFGEVEEVEAEGSRETTYEARFDDLGRLERAGTRAAARTFARDPWNQVVAVNRVDADGAEVAYLAYDRNRNGLVRAQTDGEGAAVTFGFDHANRLKRETLADQSFEEREYRSGSGAIARQTSRNGDVREYDYDAFGLISEVRSTMASPPPGYSGTSVLSFMRDVRGLYSAGATNKPNEPDDDITLTYARDSRGLAVEETSSLFDDAITYTRDGVGRATTTRVGSTDIERGFDGLGRPSSTMLGMEAISTYGYTGFGTPRTVTYGNGIVETRTADAEGRVVGIVGRVGQTRRYQHDLYFGSDGLIARFDRQIGSAARTTSVFRSDAFGRIDAANHGLTGVEAMTSGAITDATLTPYLSSGASLEAFASDLADNWTSVSAGGGAAIVPEFGDDHRYTAFGGAVEVDASGQTCALPTGEAFAYSGLGRLVSATSGQGEGFDLAFDAFGRLSAWSRGDEPTRLQYAEDRVLREARDARGSSSTLYVPGEAWGPVAVERGSLAYNHYAFGERVSIATDASGQVAELYDYTAYAQPTIRAASGTEVLAGSAVGNRLLVAGQPYFAELGLHAFGNRFYRPEWGRFLTPDPLGFVDGPNPYAYVGNQPIAFIDPEGLFARRLKVAGVDAYFTITAGAQGFKDGVAPLPQVGEDYGRPRAYAAGKVAGSVVGLGADLGAGAGGVALTGGGAVVCLTGVGCLGGAPVAAAGYGLVAASAAGVAMHGNRLSEAVEQLQSAPDDNPSHPEPQTDPEKRMPASASGHHVPAVRKSQGRPFEVGRNDTTRPTLFSRGQDPARDHWRMHNAERQFVGPRQGPFQGTDDQLFDAYRQAYDKLDDIRVDVRTPNGSVVLGTNVTPRQAVDLIEAWLRERGLR